jgi:hypothetical protein
MSRNLETQISEALTAYIDTEIHSAVQDNLCHSDIASELDLDEIVEHLDLDTKFDEAISYWMDKNMDVIAEQYRRTAEYIISGMAESQMMAWLIDNRYRFEPLHRRCWRWLKSINWKFWRKNEA